MEPEDQSIESKLREILGYLNTLGKNIQKRTQFLLDTKLDHDSLNNVRQLEKLNAKVEKICKLSVVSLNKVNAGTNLIIEKESRRRRSEPTNKMNKPRESKDKTSGKERKESNVSEKDRSEDKDSSRVEKSSKSEKNSYSSEKPHKSEKSNNSAGDTGYQSEKNNSSTSGKRNKSEKSNSGTGDKVYKSEKRNSSNDEREYKSEKSNSRTEEKGNKSDKSNSSTDEKNYKSEKSSISKGEKAHKSEKYDSRTDEDIIPEIKRKSVSLENDLIIKLPEDVVLDDFLKCRPRFTLDDAKPALEFINQLQICNIIDTGTMNDNESHVDTHMSCESNENSPKERCHPKDNESQESIKSDDTCSKRKNHADSDDKESDKAEVKYHKKKRKFSDKKSFRRIICDDSNNSSDSNQNTERIHSPVDDSKPESDHISSLVRLENLETREVGEEKDPIKNSSKRKKHIENKPKHKHREKDTSPSHKSKESVKTESKKKIKDIESVKAELLADDDDDDDLETFPDKEIEKQIVTDSLTSTVNNRLSNQCVVDQKDDKHSNNEVLKNQDNIIKSSNEEMVEKSEFDDKIEDNTKETYKKRDTNSAVSSQYTELNQKDIMESTNQTLEHLESVDQNTEKNADSITQESEVSDKTNLEIENIDKTNQEIQEDIHYSHHDLENVEMTNQQSENDEMTNQHSENFEITNLELENVDTTNQEPESKDNSNPEIENVGKTSQEIESDKDKTDQESHSVMEAISQEKNKVLLPSDEDIIKDVVSKMRKRADSGLINFEDSSGDINDVNNEVDLGAVLDMCNHIIAQVNQADAQLSNDNETDSINKVDDSNLPVTNNVYSETQSKHLIKCVNINSLMAKNIKDDGTSKKMDTSLNYSAKKNKNVTFLDKPIRINDSSSSLNVSIDGSPSKSILLNKKSKYANCWNSSIIELSDSDDSDVSNTNREFMKNIKDTILAGRCNMSVTISNDKFYCTNYTDSLREHGIKKVYNEQGKLYFSARRKKLNEDAKKSVLKSSSSEDESLSESKKKLKQKKQSYDSSSDSDSESSESFVTVKKRRKKMFTKKRHKRSDSDSDVDFKSLLKIAKAKKKSKKKLSSEDSSETSVSDEMGRSARLKQREAPPAFTQSNKERSDSDTASSSKTKGRVDSKSSKEEGNVLLDTLLNGDANKSTSDTDLSAADSTVETKQVEKRKPIVDKIKNDLLEDETSSSSALESDGKVNGKGTVKQEGKKKAKKEPVQESEDEIQEILSDDDKESAKRPCSTINLDTDSDDAPTVSKAKVKKVTENGDKGSGGEEEEGSQEDKEKAGKSGSDTEDSEIYVPRKRKRKPKKKDSSGSEDNSQDTADSTDDNKKKKRKRIKKVSGDDSSDGDEDDSDGEAGKTRGRKNIRALKKSSTLDEATKEAGKREKERMARIAERQRLYNESMFDESGKPEEISALDKVVLDFDPKTKEPIITVDKGLVGKLKPHQANGIKFMWDACFESVKQINKSEGSGCILAHCMGLGKTLQVVTLVHTLLQHKEKTKVERVLVVCPLSTVLNWVHEFRMWLEHAEAEDDINIFELSRYKQNHERAYQLKEWLECGGVCILGYDMFRNLSADNPKKFRKAMLNSFQKSLVDPGPHLVVCDEGHLLKNQKTSLSQAMNRVKTLRRIVLTGTPLQNNLKEYYCMVQFVKPNLLGKYSEYLNRFVNPITNGQYTNSTDHDIKIMKRRSHVLHKMLDGAVQRRDYAVLAPFLPPKHEYVLFISLTEIQVKLYKHYLENYSRRPNPDKKTTPSLFSDFQALQRIWTHPLVLKANSERYELMLQKKRDKEEEESEGSLVDFIDDEEETTTPEESSLSETEDSDESDRPRKKNKKVKNSKGKAKRVTRSTVKDEDDDVQEVKLEEPKLENPTEWWMSLCSEDELNDIRHSNKLLLLLDILKECEAIGDKLLVFSQSLYSLDLIEQFLSKIDDSTQRGSVDDHLGGHSGSWSQGLDYFRLDGSTSCENRTIWCKSFNREDNPRARLFLISTRAGGLGINLVAANRVVIFDMSWNPSHDVQSIFRVYRFGQKKPCYIYRFLALGTMEEKIYERQVTKQAISKRVIDEQQIDRHYTESDLAELYKFCPEPEGSREVPILPKDRLFADLLKQHDTVIYKYHEHDSLLENKEEETLSEEERKAAWEDYENEKNRPPQTFTGANFLLMQQQQQQQQMTINALQTVLRQDYPTLTDQQIAAMIPAILQQMHTNGDAALTQKLNALMAQNTMMGGQMPGFKSYPNPNMLNQGMMLNSGGLGMGIRSPMYQQIWQQQQQQLQLQRLQQQQAMQTNMKYYAGGLGSRDLMDMAAIQQQQRALLLGNAMQSSRGRPPKTILRPPRPMNTNEVVDLDSE